MTHRLLRPDTAITSAVKLSVSVDGKIRAASSENGWQLEGDKTLELRGQACTDLKASKLAKPIDSITDSTL